MPLVHSTIWFGTHLEEEARGEERGNADYEKKEKGLGSVYTLIRHYSHARRFGAQQGRVSVSSCCNPISDTLIPIIVFSLFSAVRLLELVGALMKTCRIN
ncbi:hypothetical protein CDAR_615601 [Caerostris darwini]|uniref:Uncharacterized protein n=1 Tax=Caerostris darwini TaxID=1538125 RepID=A0AAV4RS89_9ARAC|nr:hypothetical protein CDAR_615601 [Caerostris darwini]